MAFKEILKKFKQKRHFSTFEYEIVDDGSIQRKSGLTGSSVKHMPFGKSMLTLT
jgi:hypothetical protein